MARETIEDLYPGSMDDEEARKADRKLGVRFFMAPVLNETATNGGEIDIDQTERLDKLKELGCAIKSHPVKDLRDRLVVVIPCGRPIYEEVEWIRIMIPGDRDRIIERPANAVDKRRFADRYEMWKKNTQGEGAIGTPISELPFINSAQREEFRHFGVHTAEQLVGMSDAVAGKFLGINQLKERTKRYIEAASGKAQAEIINSELKARDAKIDDLMATVAALQAKLEAEEAMEAATRPEKRK